MEATRAERETTSSSSDFRIAMVQVTLVLCTFPSLSLPLELFALWRGTFRSFILRAGCRYCWTLGAERVTVAWRYLRLAARDHH